MMQIHRGIVCEIEKKHTVFLTEKGEFLRGNPICGTPDIGDEVDFYLTSTPSLYSRKVKPRFVGAFMFAAVLLFSIVASLIPVNEKVMAYVQLESDTAVELGVNQMGKVISLRYLNETLDEPEKSLDKWRGQPIGTVLDFAVKELPTGKSAMKVIITTIFPNAKSQQKMQEVVGSAVREVQGVHGELNWIIAESTAEERVAANKHKMSIHKFKVIQQSAPVNEKKSSVEIEHPKQTNPVNQQKDKDAEKNPKKQSVPIVPANQKNTGNEKSKNLEEPKKPLPRNPHPKPKLNKEQGENSKHSSKEQVKSIPASNSKATDKGNPNLAQKKPKENSNQKKQLEADESNSENARPVVGNDGK